MSQLAEAKARSATRSGWAVDGRPAVGSDGVVPSTSVVITACRHSGSQLFFLRVRFSRLIDSEGLFFRVKK